LRPVYSAITPPAPSWPTTCTYSIKYSFWFRMSRPGQASCRQTPITSFGVDPWVTDYITPLAQPPSRTMQSVTLCNACSLPGNRRSCSGFLAHSSSIQCGLPILFPCGFILVGRCVSGTRSVPSGRSNIMSCYRPQAVQSLPLLR
jgi:hypothetical protein